MLFPEIVCERQINAPVESVWKVLTDLDNAPRNLTSITAVERLEGTGYKKGVRWKETRRVFGTSATEEMQVALVSKNKRTVVESDSRGVHYRTEFTVSAADGGTKLVMTFSAEYQDSNRKPGFLTRLTSKGALKLTRSMVQQDLEDIAAAAEAG